MNQLCNKINQYITLANIRHCKKAEIDHNTIKVVSWFVTRILHEYDPILKIKDFVEGLYPDLQVSTKVYKTYEPLDIYDINCIIFTDPEQPFTTYYQHMLEIKRK